MTTSPEGPRSVLVIGTGLIGTSIARAALRAGDHVEGVDADADNAAVASARAGMPVHASLDAIETPAPDVVVIATPIPAIVEVAVEALRRFPGAVVTDVGSVKGAVLEGVGARAGADAERFVGGHPMGGTERTGPAFASTAIIDDISWVLTPSPRTREDLVDDLAAWIRVIGARPIVMDADRHDRLVATVSHLPQVASTALMGYAAEAERGEDEPLLLAAGGFRDLTRLAASSPALWGSILLANRDEVVRAIDGFVGALGALRDAIAGSDAAGVEGSFAEAKRARLAMAQKPRVRSGVAVLQVPIPDRPGALASLTAALAGTNIEDLQIVHSAEGGGGVVHLTVVAADADAAQARLAEADFASARIA